MPILGKDIKRSKEEQVKTREIKIVGVTLIHPSTILPKREGSREVMESVRRDGVHQPIIVRPHPNKEGEYEIIDGETRRFALVEKPDIRLYNDETEPKVLVDIRYGLTDADVFKLANIMHKRKGRNTYEQAEFYVKWIEAKAKEMGKEEGALTEVAKELITIDPMEKDPTVYDFLYSSKLNSMQSLLSQYCKIYILFQKLESKRPDTDFNILKSLAINKLYELTKIMDNMPKLIEVVEKLLKNPDMTLERLRELCKEEHYTEPKTSWSAMIRMPPDLTKNFHDALYKSNRQIFETQLTNNEILKQATQCLIKLFVDYPEDYEVELEKTKKGYKISAIWRKIPEIKLSRKT